MPGIGHWFQYNIRRCGWTALVFRRHCIAIHVFLSYLLVKSSTCCSTPLDMVCERVNYDRELCLDLVFLAVPR